MIDELHLDLTRETPLSNEDGPGASGVVGRVLDGRFEVCEAIGHGATGTVYRGRHIGLDRPVALKVLHPELAARPDARARFMREARMASILSHRGSVTIHDFGEWDGQLCIAMDHLEGASLGSVLADAFPLPRERVINLLLQLCDVLGAAHAIELLHRDLKPDNILLVTEPNGREVVKVVDFGLAVLLRGDCDARITQDGSMAGTPTYMSPEQALMRPLDQRSDLYTLGCVMYEMLCGVPPFRGRSAVGILSKHLYHDPVPPHRRVRCEQVDRALSEIALWCIQKEPDHRPQTAGAIAKRLRAALRDGPPRQSRRPEWNLPGTDRHERVAAAGIRPLTQRMTVGSVRPQGRVTIVQAAEQPSIAAPHPMLERQGFDIDRVLCIADLDALEPMDVDAVVFDLRPAVDRALDILHRELTLGALRKMPVIVVGPTASFHAIARALSCGAADYVAESMLPTLARRVVRAIRRAERPRTPRVPRATPRRRLVGGVDSELHNTERMGALSAAAELEDTQVVQQRVTPPGAAADAE